MQATILERDEYKLKLDEALGRTASSLVAKHVAEGGNMESWLHTRPQNSLPATLTALEADFKSWVKGKYDGPEALQATHGHGH